MQVHQSQMILYDFFANTVGLAQLPQRRSFFSAFIHLDQYLLYTAFFFPSVSPFSAIYLQFSLHLLHIDRFFFLGFQHLAFDRIAVYTD